MDLRAIRQAADLSQQELELESGVSRWRISAHESGYLQLKPAELRAINTALIELGQRRATRLKRALATQQLAV